MKIEVKVTPHSSSMRYYQIHWREKKSFNLFNIWKRIEIVWDGARLTLDHPLLYSNFDDAVNYAKKLKENPKLIQEHIEEQKKIYEKAKEKRNKHFNSRNKSINI